MEISVHNAMLNIYNSGIIACCHIILIQSKAVYLENKLCILISKCIFLSSDKIQSSQIEVDC